MEKNQKETDDLEILNCRQMKRKTTKFLQDTSRRYRL